MSPSTWSGSAALLLALAAACGGEPAAPASKAAPTPPPTLVAPLDASVVDAGITVLPSYDPSAGHLDYDPGAPTARPATGPRSRRTLELVLRSTPSGASVLVDGQAVGTTPVYWEGDFTGRAREFAFALPGHALARYRFVPTSSGVVHARLERILTDTTADAGVPAAPVPPAPPAPRPAPPPDAAPPPPPPPADAMLTAPTTPPPPGIGPAPF
jgi:hypothetical protein